MATAAGLFDMAAAGARRACPNSGSQPISTGLRHCDGEPGFTRDWWTALDSTIAGYVSWEDSRWSGLTPRESRDVRTGTEPNVTEAVRLANALRRTHVLQTVLEG